MILLRGRMIIDTNFTTSSYLKEEERRNYGQNDSMKLNYTNMQFAELENEVNVPALMR